MTIEQLLQKLKLAEDADKSKAQEEIEQFVKSQTKDAEESMQKRINALTREKHDLKSQVSDLEAGKSVAATKHEELTSKIKELDTAKVELEKFKQEQAAKRKENLATVLKSIDQVKDSDKRYPNIAKIRAKMTIKDKLEDYTDEEIDKNLEVYNTAVEFGVLDRVESSGTPNVPPSSDDDDKSGKSFFHKQLVNQQKGQ